MEEPVQPAEVLEWLLDYLASPLDNSVPLSAARDAQGEVVALRAGDAEYPVIHGVPHLLPEPDERAGADLPLWKAHQAKMWGEYAGGEEGVFTGETSTLGRRVGEVIAGTGGGLYLDVGCGAGPWPAYMAASSPCTRWIGVDPFLGDVARRFPFVQGQGEYLPFRRGIFDGALYASTIYHMLDPLRSLRRVHSVLKPAGRLFVWYKASGLTRRYLAWRGLRALGVARMFHPDFLWAYTQRALRAELKRAGFVVQDEIYLCEGCSDWATCKDRYERLVVARRT